jgi:hypothetical protein
MTATQLAALKSEIQNDPQTLGYAAFLVSGQDNAIADVLNAPRDGVTPFNGVLGTAVVVQRADISSAEVLEAVDVRDFPATVNGVANLGLATSWFESVTQQRMIRLTNDDGNDTLVLANLKRLLGNTQGSQVRLVAASKRAGSRAEKLFGTGTFISQADIAAAGVHA